MFTPENFYHVILENYCDHNGHLMVPDPNNIKDFHQFRMYGHIDNFEQWSKVEREGYLESKICMYDQEPFFPSALDTYKNRVCVHNKTDAQQIIQQTSPANLVACYLKTLNIPIWCHSEHNSAEIRDMERRLFVPCYYWYHAFISRDWYRSWQRYHALMPADRSRAPYRFLLYARDHSGTRQYRTSLVQALQPHAQAILYDWHNQRTVSPDYSAKIDLDDANQAAMHLVAETLFDTDKLHLTEKVFKPMVMSQPFVIAGPAGTLGYLRRYGFRTFDSVWSEDYDREPDPQRRLHMIADVVDELCRMPSDQFADVYARCLPIVQHNRERFFSEQFMDECWQELSDNFQQANHSRQQLLAQNPGGQIMAVLNQEKDLLKVPMYQAIAHNKLRQMPMTMREAVLARYPGISEL